MPAKQLHVLRHAKSSWDDPGLDDHDRPLAPRGRRALTVLSAYMAAESIAPELILCSTARRARETLEGLELGGPSAIEPALYTAGPAALNGRLSQVPEEVGSVLLIGHNPALQVLVVRLTAVSEGADLTDVQRKFPTGALATLSFAGAWSELGPGQARLTRFVRPKQLSKQSRSL